MKLAWSLCLAAGLGAGVLSQGDAEPPPPCEERAMRKGLGAENGQVVILMGDVDGYLSPCGCTAPMSGGIARRATAVRMLGGKDAIVLDNGSLVKGSGRQDYLKAEAAAEALRHMGTDAINLTPSEARPGKGLVQSLQNLSGELLLQSNLEPDGEHCIEAFRREGLFLIGAVSSDAEVIGRALGAEARATDDVVRGLVEEAKAASLAPILMLSGDREEAERLARAFPDLRLIQYRSTGRPLDEPLWVGRTLLASPGEHGIYVIRLLFEEGEFRAYKPIELTPEYEDDKAVARVYRRYLGQVEREDLFGKLPRQAGAKFAGTAACTKCHAKAAAVWKKSLHSHALRTLIDEGHGRDPDCVRCHVVGAELSTGFKSVKATPQLASVGCESCHAPGAAHSAAPKKFRLGKAGKASCQPCHTLANSPNFEFERYWKKIAH